MIITKNQLKKWIARYSRRHRTTESNAKEVAFKGEFKTSSKSGHRVWLILPKVVQGFLGS